MMRRLRMLLLLATLLAGAPGAFAQDEEPPRPSVQRNIDALNAESRAAFAKHDYTRAEEILRRVIELDPDNFVPWYNLACALSSQGRTEDAGPMLEKAIELGFSDRRQMEIDVHLANLRKSDNYKKLLAGWDEVLAAHVDQRLEHAKKRYGRGYTYEKDFVARLAYVSAFPADSFAAAKTEIERMISWWDTYVAPAALDVEAGADVPWVLVILPNPKDYAQWAQARYGENWHRIGGVYSHDNKTLIAKDIGSTLRHEFWHVLHWRHMDVLGQRHPVWLMEGLCSLMEDVDVSRGGPRPIASYRTNQAGRLARTGKLTPWDVLFKLDQDKFVGSRPLAFYGQSRSIFIWLFEQGKLKEWYTAYTAGYKSDRSGLSAFETVFARPVKEVEKEFKAWLRTLPEVKEDFVSGDAVLPFPVDPISVGDGLKVAASEGMDRLNTRRRVRAAMGGVLPGDVVVAVGERPIREYNDLLRVLEEYAPGAEVTITYRRGTRTDHAVIRLLERQ